MKENQKTVTKTVSTAIPMFHTIESMAKISGIGENTLRNLVEDGQIDHLRIGNKRLLTTEAMFDWYQRVKIPASA